VHPYFCRTRRLVGLCALTALLLGSEALGQQQQAPSEPRRYRLVWGDVTLRSAPRPDAKEIGKIPLGTVVQANEKQGNWVKVRVNNKVGWAAWGALQRLTDTPTPDLEFVHPGYKIIGTTYRYFFGVNHSGLANYTGPITLSLYNLVRAWLP
jgi:hypothetical protein